MHSEIYYPPYLFDPAGNVATRPSILAAPDDVSIGQNFTVGVGAAAIQRVTLVRTGSVTHSVNMDQRFLELPFTSSAGTLFVQAPTTPNSAPPGYYILFVINSAGVPSIGKIVRMNIQGLDSIAPVVTITGPTTAATFDAPQSLLTLSGTASDNAAVTAVTWTNSLGGQGAATGTSTWTSNVQLFVGTNVLTVTATDAAGNSSTDTLTVTYTPPGSIGGLAAAFGFDESTGPIGADASGNANTATLNNGPVWTTGKNGGALQFDGANDRVRVNDSHSLDLSSASTFEAWVFPTAAPTGWRTILQKEVDAYVFAASNDQNTPSSGGTLNGVCCTHVYGTAGLPINAWTHVAATYDGPSIRLYVNGAQVASGAASGTYEQNANPLWIGGNAVYGEHFQGKLDDIRIYNRALTGAEIQSDMNTPVGGAPPPADGVAPVVTITGPTNAATFATGTTPLTP